MINGKSVFMYTLNQGEIHKNINIALINDNDIELRSLMPLVGGINSYLAIHVTNMNNYIVYRGGWLPKEYLKYFIKGAVLRIPAFWSCTTNKEVMQAIFFYFILFYFFYLQTFFFSIGVIAILRYQRQKKNKKHFICV